MSIGVLAIKGSINEKESIVIHLDWVFDGKGEFDDKEENDLSVVKKGKQKTDDETVADLLDDSELNDSINKATENNQNN